MTHQDKIVVQIDLLKSIIDMTKHYTDQPITIPVLKALLREVLTEKQVELVNTL